MLDLIRELFPICRSIAGPGLRETIRRIGQRVPLTVHEVPTGTAAFDWTVPQEWSLNRATLRGPTGETIVDTEASNLHVVNYSTAFRGTMTLDALQPHLHSMPDKPTWIPYRTSYYKPTWGLCLRDDVRRSLPDGAYAVDVDTTTRDGAMTYGELVLPGRSPREVLLSAHCCHPSLANDNLSGIAVAVELARRLATRDHLLTYRFVFAPGTIGAIAWLARNREATRRIVAGLTLSCLGDAGAFTFKRSRQGDALIDRAAEASLGAGDAVRDFIPYGYDERQYCSPGFDLPVGCLMRTPHGEFPQYHTSADDVAFLNEAALEDGVAMLERIVANVERLADAPAPPRATATLGTGPRYLSRNPHCEPQLGRRGLYATTGGHAHAPQLQMAMLWALNYADGAHGIDWIAARARIDRAIVDRAVELLVGAALLERFDARDPTPQGSACAAIA